MSSHSSLAISGEARDFVIDPALLEQAPHFVLAPFGGERPPAPPWYEALRTARPEEHRVTVDGAKIEVLAWGRRGSPGILLVHGNRAHARWWGPVAPLLAADHRVAAISLSGTGGSDWRERYSSRQHAIELFAAIAGAGLAEAGPPIVVAHSFGGNAAASAALMQQAALAGVIFVDSAVIPPEMRPRAPLSQRKTRTYPDMATALSRFRLSPSQPCDAPYILDDVARAGLIEKGGQWRWRFDPLLIKNIQIEEPWDVVCNPPCRIAFVYGELSPLAVPAIVDLQRATAPPDTPIIGIPEAGHHLMFDQPFALVSCLRTLAAFWAPPTNRTSE